MIFWWRRWMLQSRSPSWTTSPLWSPSTCTSMWRTASTSCSTYSRPSPNAALASDSQRVKASVMSSCVRATLIPRPPPPAIALIIIGSPPSESKNASASSTVVAPSVPSRIGTPHRLAMARATDLSPSAASEAGDGPTKISPCSAQRAAKLACSLRKPYPGCTAVHPALTATSTICSASRYAAGPRPRSGMAASARRTGSASASSSE